MNSVTFNDKPGVRISGKLVKKISEKAGLFNCEGDRIVLPLSQVKIEANTIIIPTWLYSEKFDK
jgi:hypothetical protein